MLLEKNVNIAHAYLHMHMCAGSFFIIIESDLCLIQSNSGKAIHMLDKLIRNVKSRRYSLPVHINQLYLLEQYRESFKVWSAIIRNNTEG